LADRSRESLIFTKKELLAGLEDGMVEAPHAMYPDTDEQSYYRGEVGAAAPGTARQAVHGEEFLTDKEPVERADALAAAASLRDPAGADHGAAPQGRRQSGGSDSDPSGSTGRPGSSSPEVRG